MLTCLQPNIDGPGRACTQQAQQRTVLALPASGTSITSGRSGETTYLHLGNNWVPGNGGAGTCTNGGLLYWYPLEFAADGSIVPMEWKDTIEIDVPA